LQIGRTSEIATRRFRQSSPLENMLQTNIAGALFDFFVNYT